MDRRIELIVSLLESDVSRAWHTDALAVLVNLSTSRFRHLFKHETGTSPRQYLRELRFREADMMLATTFMSVKEVAESIGLVSVTHFMKDFKERHGMTPRAYRIAARIAAKKAKLKKQKKRR